MKKIGFLRAALCLFTLSLTGCVQTYPADKVRESIQEICREEYGIERIDVKIVGETIGVYLPIKKLFAADFKEALLAGAGKVSEIENLFQPSPEALDQVEDVLFSISRVLLSTDRKLKFYLLQATDEEKTGLQLVLIGYVDDIKRVRLWDISRNEYRKRVLHELKLNRGVVWHRPVRTFFQDFEQDPSLATIQRHFAGTVAPDSLESTFFINSKVSGKKSVRWRLGEFRSTVLEQTRVLVYVPVELEYDVQAEPKEAILIPSGTRLEYFFVVSFAWDPPKILRVIPLRFLDETGTLQQIPIPAEFELEEDLSSWETEFNVSEIQVGDFLAEQITRRVQTLLAGDERIRNTFEEVHLGFNYHRDPPKPFFSLDLDAKLKSGGLQPVLRATVHHEDILYLLNSAFREFVEVLRSYQFLDYEFLQFNLASDPAARVFPKEALELFRRNKADLQGLLTGISPF